MVLVEEEVVVKVGVVIEAEDRDRDRVLMGVVEDLQWVDEEVEEGR